MQVKKLYLHLFTQLPVAAAVLSQLLHASSMLPALSRQQQQLQYALRHFRTASTAATSLETHVQDDIVHEDLTVRENLEYSAWLRSPKYMRTRAKHDLVDDVIDVLNLRSVQHSVVGTAEKRGFRSVGV